MLPQIDELMRTHLHPEAPGAAVGVVQNGEITHAAGYGLANAAWNIPIDDDTVFRLASITKSMTASIIMMLADEGKLDVDDHINAYLPEYHTGGHHVTVRHLLNHTSGIYNYTDAQVDPTANAQALNRPTQPQDIARFFGSKPFNFRPGAEYRYNNSGYVLLGLMIERLSGQSFGDFLQTRIFEPLGMTRSRLLNNTDIVPRSANGYMPVPGGFAHAPYLDMSLAYAAGGVGSTLGDLFTYAQALHAPKLVSEASYEQMTTAGQLDDGTPLTYGYGLGVYDYEGHRLICHAGGIFGFSTFFAHFPDDDLHLIALSNFAGAVEARLLVLRAARLLFDLPEIKPRPYVIGADALQRVAGRYKIGLMPVEIRTNEDGHIFYQEATGYRLRLMPASRDKFYDAAFPETTITFEDEQDGLYQSARFESPATTTKILERVNP